MFVQHWQEYHHKLIKRGHSHGAYRMSPELFDTLLVEMLRIILVINETRSYARSEAGPIIPEFRLYCLIR
jgi:hypothetical protein